MNNIVKTSYNIQHITSQLLEVTSDDDTSALQTIHQINQFISSILDINIESYIYPGQSPPELID
jgi:flagellar hook-associated protein FlgK